MLFLGVSGQSPNYKLSLKTWITFGTKNAPVSLMYKIWKIVSCDFISLQLFIKYGVDEILLANDPILPS